MGIYFEMIPVVDPDPGCTLPLADPKFLWFDTSFFFAILAKSNVDPPLPPPLPAKKKKQNKKKPKEKQYNDAKSETKCDVL